MSVELSTPAGARAAQRARNRQQTESRRRIFSGVTAAIVALAVMVGTLFAAAAPASAAGTYVTTAAVNVRSGPGTTYGVIASAASGTPFELLCQWQSGTNVNGNSTWDRVRFGNGVTGAITDYWTSTPSWNSYAPNTGDCSAPAPSTREAKAYSWAVSEVGRTSDDWDRPIAGWCARWAVGAYGRLNSGYTTAWNMYLAFRDMGLTHSGLAPAGSYVFFAAASVNGYAGHVAIATGDGRMISTPAYSGEAIAVRPLSYAGATYVGWSNAPAGWTR